MGEEKEISLEEAFTRLQETIENLEKDDITLEQSFQEYQKGMLLVKKCNEIIDKLEKKVLVLNEDVGNEQLQQKAADAEDILKKYLPEEEGYQKKVIEAMNYSVLAGGKRLRPVLMKESFLLFGGQGEVIEPFMAALEMIHNYSLVHDDLPAMDNDEYRPYMEKVWQYLQEMDF